MEIIDFRSSAHLLLCINTRQDGKISMEKGMECVVMLPK
jgi:hypothetical protein